MLPAILTTSNLSPNQPYVNVEEGIVGCGQWAGSRTNWHHLDIRHSSFKDTSVFSVWCSVFSVFTPWSGCEATVLSEVHYSGARPFDRSNTGFSHISNNCMRSYRYGFNGMEKDDEVKCNGNSYDFGARIYDPRVGRWLAVDPLTGKYPSLTPYNFVANCPIVFVDPDGKIIRVYYGKGSKDYIKYEPGVEPTDLDGLTKIQKELVMDFHKAVTYNMNSDKGKEEWCELYYDEGVVEVQLMGRASDYKGDHDGLGENNNFLPNTDPAKKTADGKRFIGTIVWELYAELFTNYYFENGEMKQGGGIANSTLLIHEVGHAVQFSKDQVNAEGNYEIFDWINGKDSDPDYGNVEDKRNIEKVEQVYIDQINDWEKKTNKENAQIHTKRYNHLLVGVRRLSGTTPLTKRDVNEVPVRKNPSN